MKETSVELLAFRYIANELSDDERSEFEARLAIDQTAREAVAGAVELAQAIWRVESASEVTAPVVEQAPRIVATGAGRRWRTAAGWMLVGSVACLALMSLANYYLHVTDLDSTRFASRGDLLEEPRQLALAWIETRRDAGFVSGAGVEAMLSDDRREVPGVEDDIDDEPTWDDPMADVSTETPSWILAAVAETSSEAAPRQPAAQESPDQPDDSSPPDDSAPSATKES